MLKDAGTADFNDVHSGAFPYFANALAVHTEMIYYKSSMTAVQALVAMVGERPEPFCVPKLFVYRQCANN